MQMAGGDSKQDSAGRKTQSRIDVQQSQNGA